MISKMVGGLRSGLIKLGMRGIMSMGISMALGF
jgi:hypothetical protein